MAPPLAVAVLPLFVGPDAIPMGFSLLHPPIDETSPNAPRKRTIPAPVPVHLPRRPVLVMYPILTTSSRTNPFETRVEKADTPGVCHTEGANRT